MRKESVTPSGISCCGSLNWGAHFCHLYETRDELAEMLVSYFAEGLRNNEQCLWITSEPLDAVDATAALAAKVPEVRSYLDSGQIRIVDYFDLYTRDGRIEAETLLQGWIGTEEEALAKGYTGLRVNGNITFLKTPEARSEFEQYEAQVTQTISNRRILGLCSYNLATAKAHDILDVVRNHQFSIARRAGQWEVVENATVKLAKDQLHQVNAKLELHVAHRTEELQGALSVVEAQKQELELALRMRDESQRQLQAELDDARLLHTISAALINEEAVDGLYQKLVDAAVLIMRSDLGSMQRFDPIADEFRLLAHHGFTPEGAVFWDRVRPETGSTCGLTLRRRERVVVPDIAACEPIPGTGSFAPLLEGGIFAAQTTPLLSRDGTLVGAISTHWLRPHHPSDRDLRLLDIVARQAADLIERSSAAQALKAQTVELLEADRRKDAFLATLAHELRNPLAPLKTGLAVLKHGNEEASARVMQMMNRQLAHMVRLVDDLLDVSRVSRGLVVLKPERTPLRAVIDSAIEASNPLLAAAGHRFTVTLPGPPVWLNADVTRMAQVISNVLNNAAKYTPPGGRVELIAEKIDHQVVIRITDSGVGISESMRSKIFDLFVQVEASIDKSQGGLGLGLSLAKQLVELHEGTIEASSEGLGQGSVFTIRLPASEAIAESKPSQGNTAMAQATSSMRVLIVDDNVDAAETLALFLDFVGYETRVICEAPKAVEAALEFRPAVVFLDLGMPELSGFDLARLLRAQVAMRDVALVAVSGWGTSEDKSRSRDAGIDHHLTKPVSPEDVQALLARLAEKNRSTRSDLH